MLEIWQTIIYAVWLIALFFLTYVGLVELIKLKLRAMFVLDIGLWLSFTSYLVIQLNPLFSCLFGLTSIAAFFIFAFISDQEHNRANSIYQLMKKLPLKDRLLRRIPKELLEKPLPPPIPPTIPIKMALSGALILCVAVGDIISGLLTYWFSISALQLIHPIAQPIPLLLFYSPFLFLAALLIFRKHHIAGATIAIIFSILTIISGGIAGILLGIIGILGSLPALAHKEVR